VKFQGIVLAGGKSSRFGEDKALVKVKGVTLLERAMNLLKSLELEPVVITNDLRNDSFLKCRIEKDIMPHQGPLGGLYTACRLFQGASLLVLTCDMPALTIPLLGTLLARHDRRNSATLFSTRKNRIQPFPGVYEARLSRSIKVALEKDKRSMRDFLAAVSKKKLIPYEFSPRLFSNINTKEAMDSWALS